MCDCDLLYQEMECCLRFSDFIHKVRRVWMWFPMYLHWNRTEWVWNLIVYKVAHTSASHSHEIAPYEHPHWHKHNPFSASQLQTKKSHRVNQPLRPIHMVWFFLNATAICYQKMECCVRFLVILFTRCDALVDAISNVLALECTSHSLESHIAIAQNGYETYLDAMLHTKLYRTQRGSHHVNTITDIHTTHCMW